MIDVAGQATLDLYLVLFLAESRGMLLVAVGDRLLQLA